MDAGTPNPAALPRLFESDALATNGDPQALVTAMREALQRAGAVLDNEFREGRSAAELLRARAQFMDDLLCYCWRDMALPEAGFALVAVGGYGRGELHPHSDIDLMVLVADDGSTHTGNLENFLTMLWDLGLQIGHSVRSVQECISQASADITVLTNLIEARLLLGDETLLTIRCKDGAGRTINLRPGR